MYVSLKKVIIIFIFLVSIIFMLAYQNYNLKEGSYNILLVSNEEDITMESLTKNVWQDISNLYSTSPVLKQGKNINYKYLEVKNTETFKSTIEDNILKNDLVIIVGNTYNEELINIIYKYSDTNFLLIENELDIKQDNIYKVNINWDTIYNTINNFLKQEILTLRENKTLDKTEKLKVWCLVEDDKSKYNELKDKLTSLDVELMYVDIGSLTVDKVVEKFNSSDTFYIVNLNFDNQIEVIKQLVKMQKQNVYDYYKQVTTKTPVTYSVNSSDSKAKDTTEEKANTSSESTNKKNKEQEEVKYTPIHYIGLYEGDITIGEYDNMLEDGEILSENILDFEFELDYKEYLDEVIFNANAKHSYTLNTKSETLKFEKIES